MKTLKDLFELVLQETELNSGKQCTFLFEIDTKYQVVSMVQCYNVAGLKDNIIFQRQSIETPAKLQLVYWTIFDKGRSQNFYL